MSQNMPQILPSIEGIVSLIYLLNFLISLAIIFREHKNPTATLAWLMVLYTLPGVGLVLYLILSQNIARQKIFKLTRNEEKRIRKTLGSQIREMDDSKFRYVNDIEKKWQSLIKLNQHYSNAFLSQENDVRLYMNGRDYFRDVFYALEDAKTTINVDMFIMKPDEVGVKFMNILTKKAKEGVEVRLLLDSFGSRLMNRSYFRTLEEAGGKVAFFFPIRLFRINPNINYRNHRKIIVVDHEVCFTGGSNIALEYTGQSERFGGWRDTNLKLTGPCVEDMEARFLLDWRYVAKEDYELASRIYYENEKKGNVGVQILSCGPDAPSTEIKQAYLKIINDAKKSIRIQTPYFIPDDSIFEALKSAALSGIDVRMMIPNQPDHPFVYWVTYYNCGALLDSGVKVYIYNKGFLHAKTIAADGEVSSVGSANFDKRSFSLNFECNAVMYDSRVASDLEAAFDRDIKDSVELSIEGYRNRSLWIRFKESISRLVSDIL
jgi:cardiolipin synthase